MDAEMSKRVLDEFLKKTEDGFIVVDKEGISGRLMKTIVIFWRGGGMKL